MSVVWNDGIFNLYVTDKKLLWPDELERILAARLMDSISQDERGANNRTLLKIVCFPGLNILKEGCTGWIDRQLGTNDKSSSRLPTLWMNESKEVIRVYGACQGYTEQEMAHRCP